VVKFELGKPSPVFQDAHKNLLANLSRPTRGREARLSVSLLDTESGGAAEDRTGIVVAGIAIADDIAKMGCRTG
jgi:hypothetical protein